MSKLVRIISIIWIIIGFVGFVLKINKVEDASMKIYYTVITALIFLLSITVILIINKFNLPISFWNFSPSPDKTHSIYSIVIKQHKFIIGLLIVLILSLASLLMGYFGIPLKIKECYPYYIIGILGSLLFTLLVIHNYSMKIFANDNELFVSSIFGWSQIDWDDVSAIELVETTNRPKRTISNQTHIDSNIYATYKTLVFIDKNSNARIRLSPENIQQNELQDLLNICNRITGQSPSTRKVDKNLNPF